MFEQALQEKLDLYKDLYSQLHKELKWKMDKRSVMLIAAMYVTGSKEFQMKRFLELADLIKKEAGFLSHLKSALRFTTAATLDTQTMDAKEGFYHFNDIYKKFIENGGSRTVYTYIAAGTLLKVEPNRIDEYIQKTAAIHKGMKEHHFFLTNQADYPLAAVLSLLDQETNEIVDNMEAHYSALKEKGFSSGNDLQFLSQILALHPEHPPVEAAEQCWKILNVLKDANFKTKKAFYPYLGMLTYLEKFEDDVKTLCELNEQLNREPLFKWNKDINFMISIMLLMNHLSTFGEAATTSLRTSIETLIQAQQAAMAASAAAAAAASASSSSGNS